MNLTPATLRYVVDRLALRYEAARRSFRWYLSEAMPEIKLGRHHFEMIEKVQALEDGELGDKNLAVFTPPRHTKTTLCSVAYPSWAMGKNHRIDAVVASYGKELSNDIGRRARTLMSTDLYFDLFRKRLTADSTSVTRFHLTDQSSYFATGIGGGLTGKSMARGVIDDPIKNMEEARNPEHQAKIRSWHDTVFYTRRLPGCRLLYTQTLWSENDITLQLINENPKQWEVLRLPAISETGHALWPEWFPLPELEKIRKLIGNSSWQAMFQQSPTAQEGGVIKSKWLRYYTEKPRKFDTLIQSWDMTFKKSDGSDFVCGQVWGKYQGNFYLVYQIRKRMSFTESLSAVIQMRAMFPQTFKILIEDSANGPAIIDALKHRVPGIIPVKAEKSKEARLSAVSPLYESGNVWYPDPKNCSWIHEHIDELLKFPNAKHDDTVDAATQALHDLHTGFDSRLEALLAW